LPVLAILDLDNENGACLQRVWLKEKSDPEIRNVVLFIPMNEVLRCNGIVLGTRE